ncbi:hypothetical protein CBW24_00455 [Pacificitalea manganoxidans]|uniref:Uncharacterized protein n=1 Tax=Pacificitalea manganoxidans TaxID=1411902 RepID=A0A291LVA4_9RHOB|nr:hypothetical protein CBW24_00455 [Pacificitalea manganoxidans]
MRPDRGLRKGGARGASLSFGGKKNPCRALHHLRLCRPPDHLLGQMAQRRGTAKPRVEHPMGKHDIGQAAGPRRAPAADHGMVPEPMNDAGVEAVGMRGDPLGRARGVAISPQPRSQRMQGQREPSDGSGI